MNPLQPNSGNLFGLIIALFGLTGFVLCLDHGLVEMPDIGQLAPSHGFTTLV